MVNDRKKRYQATRKAKQLAFKQEVDNLRAAQAARLAAPKPQDQCDPEWLEFLSSAGFGEWYEEVVCKPARSFVDSVLNGGGHVLMDMSLTEWVAHRIRRLLEDNRWQTPAYRRYWIANVRNCADSTKRRAIILRLATPKWADLVAIARFHRRRAAISAETGVPHHVDHIVPLQGLNACGLNNEFNLRIIPATENLCKSNKF